MTKEKKETVSGSWFKCRVDTNGPKQASKQLCEEKAISFICYPCSMFSKVMVGMNDLVDSLPPKWESERSQMLQKDSR